MNNNFFNADQPLFIVSPLYLESKRTGIFAIACLEKMLVFRTLISD